MDLKKLVIVLSVSLLSSSGSLFAQQDDLHIVSTRDVIVEDRDARDLRLPEEEPIEIRDTWSGRRFVIPRQKPVFTAAAGDR